MPCTSTPGIPRRRPGTGHQRPNRGGPAQTARHRHSRDSSQAAASSRCPPTILCLLFTAWYMPGLVPILACTTVIPADLCPACRERGPAPALVGTVPALVSTAPALLSTARARTPVKG